MSGSASSDETKYHKFLRTAGNELEAALRDAGQPLPLGVTGAELVRALLEESREQFETAEAKQVRKRVQTEVESIIRDIEGKLPGGHANPDFQSLLLARLNEWAGRPPHAT